MKGKAIDLQAVRQAEERLKALLEEHPELRDPARQEALAAWLQDNLKDKEPQDDAGLL